MKECFGRDQWGTLYCTTVKDCRHKFIICNMKVCCWSLLLLCPQVMLPNLLLSNAIILDDSFISIPSSDASLFLSSYIYLQISNRHLNFDSFFLTNRLLPLLSSFLVKGVPLPLPYTELLMKKIWILDPTSSPPLYAHLAQQQVSFFHLRHQHHHSPAAAS